MTRVKGGLRFADTGTSELRSILGAFRRVKVRVGIAAVCKVADRESTRRPMTIKVWPRLDDDFVNGAQNRDRL